MTRPSELVRVPGYVPTIDGLRGGAAALVALFHCWLLTDAPLGGGGLRALLVASGLGVDFFFVISGFVLFLPVVRNEGAFGSVAGYALRRIARIAPAYYVAVLVQALATPLLSRFASPFETPAGLAVVGAHLLFLQHEIPRWLFRRMGFRASVMGFGVNGALWSLSIEALFYAALPLVAGFAYRRPRRAFALGIAAALCWRLLAYSLPPLGGVLGAARFHGGVPRLFDQFPGFLAHFAFGMAGAWLYVRAQRRPAGALRRLAGPLQAAALAALLLAMLAYGRLPGGTPTGPYARYFADLVPAFAFAALLLAASLGSPRAQWPLSNGLARWLGDASYGAFLWHFPLILLFSRTLGWVGGRGDGAFVGLVALVLPSAFALGWASRRWIEEPAIAWARARTRGATPRAPEPAPGR